MIRDYKKIMEVYDAERKAANKLMGVLLLLGFMAVCVGIIIFAMYCLFP